MLEPIRVASQLLALAQSAEKDSESPSEPETLVSFTEKMGMQKVQISEVRKFVDKQIEDELQRERIKQSLIVLEDTLNKQGLTLAEIIERHLGDLQARAEVMGLAANSQKIGQAATVMKKNLNRFDISANS